MGDFCEIDLTWTKHQFTERILPQRYLATLTDNGFVQCELDRRWSPRSCDVATLITQARSVYIFAVGYLVTHQDRYRIAACHCADFLLRYFKDSVHGGYYWSVGCRGDLRSKSKHAPGHAQLLLAFCALYRATNDMSYLKYAMGVADNLRTRFRDPHGGVSRSLKQTWEDPETRRFLTPITHAVESYLFLADTLKYAFPRQNHYHENHRNTVLAEVRRLADFLIEKSNPLQNGGFPEFFAITWRPLAEKDGGVYSSGHQFMWAWLLSVCAEVGFPDKYQVLADRLLKNGIKLGLCDNGAIRSYTNKIGSVKPGNTLWWEQAEAIRAISYYIARHDRNDLVHHQRKLVEFANNHFIDPEYGGWYYALRPDGTVFQDEKGNPWKVDYHQASLCYECCRVQDTVATRF